MSTSRHATSPASRVRAGAALSITTQPEARAVAAASATTARGSSSCMSSTPLRDSISASAGASAVTQELAPEATMIVFSPERSTTMKACPVGAVSRRTELLSIRASAMVAASTSPASSVPTAPMKHVGAPARAAATAWLSPLPPGYLFADSARMVSPGDGMRSTVNTVSRFALPRIVTPLRPVVDSFIRSCRSLPQRRRLGWCPKSVSRGRGAMRELGGEYRNARPNHPL